MLLHIFPYFSPPIPVHSWLHFQLTLHIRGFSVTIKPGKVQTQYSSSLEEGNMLWAQVKYSHQDTFCRNSPSSRSLIEHMLLASWCLFIFWFPSLKQHSSNCVHQRQHTWRYCKASWQNGRYCTIIYLLDSLQMLYSYLIISCFSVIKLSATWKRVWEGDKEGRMHGIIRTFGERA